MCVPEFNYRSSKNPRRVLTKPSQPKFNNGHDNEDSDYILYVNDVLGVQENRKYMVLDILGHGTFGQVVKCQDLKTQELVAIKVVKSKPVYLNQSLTEANILEHLNNKVDPQGNHHFLQMKDKFIHKNHLCIVTELLSSNLYDLIRQNQYHGLTIKLIKKFAIQLLDSLCVLKQSKLIHCDLKPENILLCSLDKPDLKVIDFGSACHERQVVYTYIQSRFYRSPEVILGLSYTTSVDMWSFGCIIAELFLGLPLFPGTSEFNQLTRIVDMLGMPPNWMIECGKSSMNFFNLQQTRGNDGKLVNSYSLKSLTQFSQEHHTNEQPGKDYFHHKNLPDIIMNYELPQSLRRHHTTTTNTTNTTSTHSSSNSNSNSPSKSPSSTTSSATPTAPITTTTTTTTTTNPTTSRIQQTQLDKEMHNRKCLVHFLQGVLNMNPLERWTPQEACMHPFVTDQVFDEVNGWNPPGIKYGLSASGSGAGAGVGSGNGNGNGVGASGGGDVAMSGVDRRGRSRSYGDVSGLLGSSGSNSNSNTNSVSGR
ncbi:unnamed protein product [Ambrosiozyma monospora]|uniref:Unnamed protein product n=1 Tax=Ambrosiozyma monospora TaxID=43982 RepID=A0ACB5TSF1_AMBMO|nr:unnamed protein product [Ambrosiozyma monospora]